MKIVHLITSLNVGGTEKFLSILVHHQSLHKHDIDIIFLKDEGIIASQLKKDGFQVRRIDDIGGLYSYLKKSKPDVLHSHLFRANIIGRMIGKLAGVPVIISSQQSIDRWKKPWHWWMEYISARWVNRIIANSHAAKNALIDKGKIPAIKVDVVTIGINNELFAPTRDRKQVCKELNIPEDKDIVLYVGRLHREKGSHYISQVIEETIRLNKNIIFVIIGYGPLKDSVLKEIAEKKLEKYVIIRDVQLDIVNILNVSSVFFLPSLEESFSNAALEAMAVGKPVVITDVGGNNELVEDSKDGFLVPPGNPEAMAGKIAALCASKNLYEMISKNARMKAKKFDMSTTLKGIDTIYARLQVENN